MNILQYQECFLGRRLRIGLKETHGIDCEPVSELKDYRFGFTFTTCSYALFSYVRPSNGQRVWLIEASVFSPPDDHVWRSWIVDAAPSVDEMERIIGADAQVGPAPAAPTHQEFDGDDDADTTTIALNGETFSFRQFLYEMDSDVGSDLMIDYAYKFGFEAFTDPALAQTIVDDYCERHAAAYRSKFEMLRQPWRWGL